MQPKYPAIAVVAGQMSDWELVKAVSRELESQGVSSEDRRAFLHEALALKNEFVMGEVARNWVTIRVNH